MSRGGGGEELSSDGEPGAFTQGEFIDDGIAVGTPTFEHDDAPHVAADPGPATPVAAAEAERDEYLGSLQRLQADFENYKKRVVRQREEEGSRAARELVSRLLEVLDTLDLAVQHLVGPGEASAASEESGAGALEQARLQLLEVLKRDGLERVDAPGVAFDPAIHDAVAHAPADEGDDEVTVEEVLRAGYLWRGLVLRPAMVRVRG